MKEKQGKVRRRVKVVKGRGGASHSCWDWGVMEEEGDRIG